MSGEGSEKPVGILNSVFRYTMGSWPEANWLSVRDSFCESIESAHLLVVMGMVVMGMVM